VTHALELVAPVKRRANSGAISTRRDGRVVDGGGLENRSRRSLKFANLFLNFARHAR
jgi:hypothetical protein